MNRIKILSIKHPSMKKVKDGGTPTKICIRRVVIYSGAMPHLFAYLNDPAIPYTSNQLEGYFTHLKEKLTLHRGLRFESRKNFIKWYIHFKNNKI